MSTSVRILSWALRLLVAGVLLQTLFFKFTAAEESVYIFTRLGMEPWGRIGSGIAELIAATLLLISASVPAGGLLALGVISGAIFSHLTKLGIVVKDDGGLLFVLAMLVFVCSLGLLYIHRKDALCLRAMRMLQLRCPVCDSRTIADEKPLSQFNTQ